MVVVDVSWVTTDTVEGDWTMLVKNHKYVRSLSVLNCEVTLVSGDLSGYGLIIPLYLGKSGIGLQTATSASTSAS